jgi:hypothetical protein
MNRMQTLSLAAASMLLIGLAASSSAADCSLAALGFMAGDWQNSSNPRGAQERWVLAPGDVLMGGAWELPEGKAGYAEIMTIRQDDKGAVVMLLRHFDGGLKRAWEERDAPMVFAASSCNKDAAVFDGQGDRAGEHLTYRRSGNDLLIIGDFLHHGKPDHEEWHMVRAGS